MPNFLFAIEAQWKDFNNLEEKKKCHETGLNNYWGKVSDVHLTVKAHHRSLLIKMVAKWFHSTLILPKVVFLLCVVNAAVISLDLVLLRHIFLHPFVIDSYGRIRNPFASSSSVESDYHSVWLRDPSQFKTTHLKKKADLRHRESHKLNKSRRYCDLLLVFCSLMSVFFFQFCLFLMRLCPFTLC